MAITRFEPVTVVNLIRSIDASGEASISTTDFFMTVARVRDVKNSLKLNELYRLYADYVNFQMNYTQNTRMLVEDQENYGIEWRGDLWRIIDTIESDDRMDVTLLCYYAKPGIKV